MSVPIASLESEQCPTIFSLDSLANMLDSQVISKIELYLLGGCNMRIGAGLDEDCLIGDVFGQRPVDLICFSMSLLIPARAVELVQK